MRPLLKNPKFSGKLKFFILVTTLILICFNLIPSHDAETAPPQIQVPLGEYPSFQAKGDIRRFAGETLLFDISFLWFTNAATAKARFYRKEGGYFGILEAQTKGFVGFFTSYRKHIYKSQFSIVKGGNRVRTDRFERIVIEGDKEEKTDHYFDYAVRKHKWFVYVNDDLVEVGQNDIPEGHYFDDVLAAFYNFRNSVYGKVESGAKYEIFTIPEKGHGKIYVQIKNGQEQEEFRTQNGRAKREEWLLNIIVPKKLFKTKTGELLVWGSKHLIPLETTVKDYILLGDLNVKFKKRIMETGPAIVSTSAPPAK